MTILDLINKSAVMLNIQEVINDASLTNLDLNSEQDCLNNNFALKRMFEFVKIVLNEISSHLPKITEAECKTTDKKISLDALTRVSKIISVKNNFGHVKYSIVDGNIRLEQDGTYTIIYKQYPLVDSILNEIDIYSDMLGEDILVYGLNAYYCLATGVFSEFNVYNAHYIERLNGLKNLKLFAMPRRSWQ